MDLNYEYIQRNLKLCSQNYWNYLTGTMFNIENDEPVNKKHRIENDEPVKLLKMDEMK